MTRRGLVVATLVASAVSVPVTGPAPSADAATTTTFYRPADGVFHIAGHGYGHGHGMSQWGAYGGAQSGKTYPQILAWYYNSPAFGTASGTIKVQIVSDGKGSDGRYDVQVKPATGLTATDSANHKLVLPTKASDGTSYDVYRAVILSDGTFRVEAHKEAGWVSLAPTGTGLTATSWGGWVRFTATGGVLDLLKSTGTATFYRDALELDKVSGTVGMTVNRTSLEHYLTGVVSSEMPCSWTPTVSGTKRLDALESQAVAARTYAAWRRQHPRSSQVDIVDSTADQAYFGYSAEKSALTACPWTNPDGSKTSAEAAAVRATAGKVMVDSSGNPLFAQYSASNGGYETSGGQSYLPSRPDAWDGVPTDSWSSHSWTDSFTAGQVQAAYPSVGTLASVAVTSRENLSGTNQNGVSVGEQWGGRILSLTLSGSAGSTTTTGASFAGALGLMSPWFTVVVHKPAAPASVSATAGDAQATVRWTPPPTDGGGGVLGYTITASPPITPVMVSASSRSAVIAALSNDTTYSFFVAARNSAGTGPNRASTPVTPSARVVVHALPAARILDTRTSGGRLGAGVTRSVRVTGVAGVPTSGAVDVLLSVASLDSTTAGSLSVFPHGFSRPADPQLSWPKAQRVNALIPVKVGKSGLVDIRNTSGTTQLVIDVEGYTTAVDGAGDVLTPAPAYRLFDSRPNGAIPAGGARSFPVVGRAGVPTGATAVLVQLTAVRPAASDAIRAWGVGASKPTEIQLYAPAGRFTDGLALVPLTSAGSMYVSPVRATDLAVTLVGWLSTAASPSTGVTSLVTPPHRVFSTTVAARSTVTVSTGAPSTVDGAILSVTATGPLAAPLSIYTSGGTPPWMWTLHLASSPVATTVVTPLTSGKIDVRNGSSAAVRVVIDVSAWTAR